MTNVPFEILLKSQLMSFAFMGLIILLIWASYRKSGVSQEMKYLSFWPRFWASPVDSVILIPIGLLQLLILKTEVFNLEKSMLVSFATYLIWFLYIVVMHGKYGQTLGKMVCKIKVVDHETEQPISYRQSLLREGIQIGIWLALFSQQLVSNFDSEFSPKTLFFLSCLPSIWSIGEVSTMFSNKKRRSLHDYIAGTVVVRTNIEDLPEFLSLPLERDENYIKINPQHVDYSYRFNNKSIMYWVASLSALLFVYMIWSQNKSY
ncbi:MAG: RDD family protein [Methyloglobulus sp.]